MARTFLLKQASVYALALALCTCGGPTEPASQAAHSAKDLSDAKDPHPKVAGKAKPLKPGERLIYSKAGSIWSMHLDAESKEPSIEQLTVRSHQYADSSPLLSPSGHSLFYVSAKAGHSQIYRQSFADLIPDPISDGPDFQPAISFDGTQLAFMRGDESMGRDLFLGILPAHGSDASTMSVRKLVSAQDSSPEHSGTPTFHPNGSIIWSADKGQGAGSTLWRFDLKQNKEHRLTPPAKEAWHRDKDPVVAPDGLSVVFASNRHAGSSDDADDFDLYRIPYPSNGQDFGSVTRLSSDPGTVATPAFSQDGSRLFFASTRLRTKGFEWEIYAMPAQGGRQERLTRDERPENSDPCIGPLRAE